MSKPPPGFKVMLPPSMTNAPIYIWLKQRPPQHDGKVLIEAALEKTDEVSVFEMLQPESGKLTNVALIKQRGPLTWREIYPLWIFATYNHALITGVWDGDASIDDIKAKLKPNPDGTDHLMNRDYYPDRE